MNAPARDHARPARPTWSVSQAAKYCQTSRTSIQRALKAGKLPQAKRESGTWQIPIDDLIAAGFTPDNVGAPPLHATMHAVHPHPARPEQEILDLREQLQEERARRELAEQAVRLLTENLTDLRTTVRMLEAPKPATTEEPGEAPATSPTPAKRRRWWRSG